MTNFAKINHTDAAVTSNLNHLVAGDFNGDGKQDFLAVRINYPDIGKTAIQSEVYLGNGQGQFTVTNDLFVGGNPFTNFASRVYARDFNNDGVDDILFTDHGMDTAPYPGSTLKLFLSENGKLTNSSSLLTQTISFYHQASFGDVDNDGKLDILTNSLTWGTGGDALFKSNETGGFSQSSGSVWNSADSETHTASVIADVNGDYKADIILGAWSNFTGPSRVMFGDGTGNFSNDYKNLPNSPITDQVFVEIRPIDLNGDKYCDLITSATNAAYTIPYFQLLVNNGDGTFRDETQIRFPQTISHNADQNWHHRIEVVDFNHDGFSDMYVGGPGGDEEAILINDGTGKFSKQVISINQWQTGTVADVNNDGMTDIILTAENMNLRFDTYINTMTNGHIYKANFGGDTLSGSNSSDIFISSDGNDKFTGNGGVDIAKMHGISSNYSITTANGITTVKDNSMADGIDTLINISRIQFTDKTVALDINGNAGQAYRVYQAAFDRKPDNGGLKYWIDVMDKGESLETVASGFLVSQEFKNLYGANPTTEQFVTKLYNNVLHRAPEQAGFDYWVGLLKNHKITETQTLVNFSESDENQVAVIGVIQNGIELTN